MILLRQENTDALLPPATCPLTPVILPVAASKMV